MIVSIFIVLKKNNCSTYQTAFIVHEVNNGKVKVLIFKLLQ